MEECSQNGFAIEMRTLPLIFLPFDKEKANEKIYLIHLLLLNFSLKCHFLYLVTVYDNFFMSQYAKNFFFNFHFQYFLLWYNKDLYSLYHEFLGVTISFLNCYYFFNIPVVVFFWCNGPGQFVSLHYLICFFFFFSRCVPLDSGLIIVMWQILFQCTGVSRDWAFLIGEEILNPVPFKCAVKVLILSEAI